MSSASTRMATPAPNADQRLGPFGADPVTVAACPSSGCAAGGGSYTGPSAAQFIAAVNNSHDDLFFLVGAVIAAAFAPLFVRAFFGWQT